MVFRVAIRMPCSVLSMCCILTPRLSLEAQQDMSQQDMAPAGNTLYLPLLASVLAALGATSLEYTELVQHCVRGEHLPVPWVEAACWLAPFRLFARPDRNV